MTRRVSGTLPNLINGVSQQAPALRLPTQAQLQENLYSTLKDGLKDRAPTEHVAKLLAGVSSTAFTHIIDRDENEQYVVVIEDGSIRVWDFDGQEKTVATPNGLTYITGLTDPRAELEALTVADYSFIVNKNRVVENDTPTSPERNPEGLIHVAAGNYGKNYSIFINGVEEASFTTPHGDVPAQIEAIRTENIASELYDDLVANGFNTGDWAVALDGNVIHIMNTNGDEFTLVAEDGFNGKAMIAIKDRVQRFSDLPAKGGPNGIVVEVAGDDGTPGDNYWVKLEFGNKSPVWKESLAPGTVLGVHPATMPHILVREEDGTFTYKGADWDPRKVGDAETSPDPSFVGATIRSVFFHRNRLGLLSDENVILSRHGSYFDFYRTTTTALLDDDPIDVAATHMKISILHHVVPLQDDLFMLADQTQFRLAGNELLSPKSVSARALTGYAADRRVRPIAVGTAVFFVSSTDDWSNVLEFQTNKVTQTSEALNTTAHVPEYIPNGVFKLSGYVDEGDGVLVALTENDASAVFIYKFLYDKSGDNKIQSSWSRWPLGAGVEVLNAELIKSTLYLLLKRADGVLYLEKIKMQPGAADSGVGFMVHLNRRVHSDDLAAPSYSATLDQTTFVLPYTVTSGIKAVSAPGGTIVAPAEQTVVGHSGTSVTLEGDLRNQKLWFGYTSERRYRLSRIYPRVETQSGGSRAITEGRLQLRYITVAVNNTAHFRVEVTPKGRGTYTYNFTGRVLSSSDNVVGEVPLLSTRMSVPIAARNDQVTIDFVNDSWMPSAFLSVSWQGTHAEKARAL